MRGCFVLCAIEESVASEWGELDDVVEDVKENWDDSEGEVEGEGEIKGEGREEVQGPVSVSHTRDNVSAPDTVAQEVSVADESDSDVTDESESSSESEDDSLSGPERQRARVYRRLQVRRWWRHERMLCALDQCFVHLLSLETQSESRRRTKC